MKPRRVDARRNRAKILAAAERVFALLGPAASTELVAQRAGVGIGTVYRHFPSKAGLLRAVAHRGVERLTDQARVLLTGGDSGAAFTRFLNGLIEQSTNPGVVELLATPAVPDLEDAVLAWRDVFGTLLAGAQRVGVVDSGYELDEVLAIMAGLCGAARGAGWNTDLAATVTGFVLDGLRSPRMPTGA